jgi:DNA-binding NtrC family response regulator
LCTPAPCRIGRRGPLATTVDFFTGSDSTEPHTEIVHIDDVVGTIKLPRCKLVVLKGADAGRELVVDRDLIRVGQAPENDLTLTDKTVSRRHFEIRRDAGGYVLRDLGSTNGVFYQGSRVREVHIAAGAVFRAGNTEIEFLPSEARVRVVPSEQDRFGPLLGRSLKMREIFGLLEKISPIDATVIITGETGTGKDVVARSIHEASHRADGPYIVVDCGGIASSLIESELFGHEKGAFTGAVGRRAGAFELADGGTVFLDEIGELPLELQPKLLRVLEAREIRPVGASRSRKVDVRIIAATNRELREEVEHGRFRSDLYFRLGVIQVRVPRLAERKDDVPLLAQGFLDRCLDQLGQAPGSKRLAEGACRTLQAHDWPGNVRELRNVVERAVFLTGAGAVIEAADIPLGGAGGAASPEAGFWREVADRDPGFKEAKERWVAIFERRYLEDLMRRCHGNLSEASRCADVDRKYLRGLLRKYDLRATEE